MQAATLVPDMNCDISHSEDFRRAMRELASGVSIVTTGQGRSRSGLTVTSVSSLSMEPMSLIVCLNQSSSTLPLIRANRSFGVSFLGENQRDLADRFAGRQGLNGAERFDNGRWIELMTGAPLLDDALAAIDCSVDIILDRHTHAIVIGQVQATQVRGGNKALTYWRGEYAAV
jgi:flavin reductase (DIM6/NTAB) family NADH-FMN oxidoreductase RutF